MKTLKQTAGIFFNFLIFIAFSAILMYIWWIIAGKIYLQTANPMGGDYFNALTYANFFANSLPFPPTGWISFWNEGAPVIGGYPWLMFYLMYPLTQFFDIATSMEIFSAGSIVLFFIASFLLFWQVSKNWILAFGFTLVLIATRATYYPLMTGGFVVSASVQWYLPAVLFFIYKFGETTKKHYIILASILTGISLLQHAPTSLLMIFLPTLVVLMTLPTHETLKEKALNLILFTSISFTIGSTGLYTVFLQTFLGSGADLCQSPQCWGIYPKHLIVWMNLLTPLILVIFLIFALLAKFFKRSTKLLSFLPALAGFAMLFLYALLAHLQVINGLANVVFPTRVFWAANLFLLLITASLFHILKEKLPTFSYVVAVLTTGSVAIFTFLYPPLIHKDRINTIPPDAANYVIPKYKSNDLSALIPTFLPLNETNWRLDTFNPGLTHWWNFVSKIPSTRGYSDHPVGIHRDWQYFLQFATRDPKTDNQELVKNRALFLLDAFGVGYHENSIASYPQSVISDPQTTIKNDQKRDFVWSQFSSQVVSPIVSPTNSNTVLFIGDDLGYESFIRTIAMTNLNSFVMIPIKGTENIDSIDSEDLKQFKTVILYRFTGGNWSRITSYVKNGGIAFIETGSNSRLPKGKLEEVFPVDSLVATTVQGNLNAQIKTKSKIVNDIKIQDFSPFIFENGPWKLSTSSVSNIRSWAQPLISKDDHVLLAQGTLGKGSVVWSGMNLFFHIVQNDNLEEAKLFKNILGMVATKTDIKAKFTVNRPQPEEIVIDGNNFHGIYFKENYHSGWNAKVYPEGNRRMNGQQIPIYKAGLDFMYISIPKNLQSQPLNVSISYVGNTTTWGLFLLSVFSFIFSSLYILFPQPFQFLAGKVGNYCDNLVTQPVKSWLEKE